MEALEVSTSEVAAAADKQAHAEPTKEGRQENLAPLLCFGV